MTPRRLAIAWTLAIVVACLLPGSSLPSVQPFGIDKWVHAGLFLGLGGLWALAEPDRAWRIFGWGVALAVAIEILQGALGMGRTADPLDAAADVVGLAAGLGLAHWAARRASNDPGGGVSR